MLRKLMAAMHQFEIKIVIALAFTSFVYTAENNEIVLKSKRAIRNQPLVCNLCTTTNYVDCCAYQRLCCEYIYECPPPSSIQCFRACSWGGCDAGQRCCPVTNSYACCANIVTTINPMIVTTVATTRSSTGSTGPANTGG
ncbi:hypothetical protein CHUAL_011847 [Chamberlinius hualienensis]